MRGSFLGRLAPIAFVGGLVLVGLGLFVLSFAAGGEPRLVEYREEGVANGTAYLAYPIPLESRSDLRLDVSFHREGAPATAMTADCRTYDRVRAGGGLPPPSAAGGHMRTSGHSGSFSTQPLPRTQGGLACPFVYVLVAWDAREDGAAAPPPEVTVVVASVLVGGPVGAITAAGTILGALLAVAGGVAWGQRLHRRVGPPPAPDDESTAETMRALVERGGAWIERTRRYLIAAGILGIFLWYPVLLPWAWTTALRGTREAWTPWLLAAGALAVLFALTAIWAREYLRLDRELLAWRERVERLRSREEALVSRLEG